MNSKIEKEMGFLLGSEKSIGFFGFSVSRPGEGQGVSATTIVVCEDGISEDQQSQISNKMFEVFAEAKELYAGKEVFGATQCLVKGCRNVSGGQILFKGPICEACADMLEAGHIVEPGPTFIHEFVGRHMKMAEDFGKLVEANKALINGGTTTYKGKSYCFREVDNPKEITEQTIVDEDEGEKLKACPCCVEGVGDKWDFDMQICHYCGFGKANGGQGGSDNG